MAIVGSAEVIIRAIGDKLEGDIQRSLNNAAKAAGPAGEKTGDNYMDGIAKSIRGNQGQIDGALNKAFEKAGQKGAAAAGKNAGETIAKNAKASGGAGAAKAGDQIGKRIGDNVSRGMGRSNMRRGIGSVLLKLGVLIPVVGIIVGGLSTLVSGLFAMSSTMSLAASSSVALVGALGAVGLAATAGFIGFKGVGQAIKDGMDPARAEQFAESMKKVAPAAKPFIKDFIKLKDEFKGIRNAAAEGLFNGLGNALRRLAPILPKMQNEFNVLGQAAGDAVETIVRKFTAGDFRRNMGEIVGSAPIVVSELARAFGNLGQTMASVLAAAAPLTERFAASVRRGTKSLRDSAQAGKESGKLQSFFNRAGDAAAQMGRIIGNVAKGLFDIGKIGGSTGQRIFDAMEKASKGLADYTDKKKNVDGLKKAFDGIGTNLIAIGGLAKEVGRSFLRMGASPGIAKTADALKKIVPDIERALTAGIDLGPKIAKFIGELAKMFTALQQSGALGAVIDIFTAVAKAIRVLLELPFAGGVIKILAIVTALRLLGRAGSFMGGMLGANLRAVDAAFGRTVRTANTLRTPLTALNNQAVRMGRGFQTSSIGLATLGARAQYAGTHIGTYGRATDRAYQGTHRLETKTRGVGGVLGRIGTGFKGVGLGGALASVGLLTAGAASASAGGKISKFSATLTGAGIGAAFGGWGAPIGAAVGGLIDLGRHFLSTGDQAKKGAAKITAATQSLSATTSSAIKSAGKSDNFDALKKAQTQLESFQKQKFEAKIGSNTTALDKGISSAKKNVADLMASIKKGTNNFDIKINFAQSMSDLKGFMGQFRSTVREIEQRTGKKFKFDIDSGPFQQASRDLYTSLRSVGEAAKNAGGPAITDFRNKIQSLRGTFGLSADGATILANKLMGLPNLLDGIKNPEKLKLDADTTAALRALGIVESDFAQAAGKPYEIDMTANGNAANASIDQVINHVKSLPPNTAINITAPNGKVVATTVGQLQAAIEAIPPSTTAYIDESGANTAGMNISRTQQILDALGSTTAEPTITGNPTDLLGAVQNSLSGLGQIDAKEAVANISAKLSPGGQGAINTLTAQTNIIDATDVAALVGAKKGNMAAVAEVLRGTGQISKTDAKAIAGSKKGDMKPLAEVLRAAGLIDDKTFNALVGTKFDGQGTGPAKEVGREVEGLSSHPGVKVPVGLEKAKSGSGLFGTIGELMRSLAPPQKTINVQVNALTGPAKLAIAGLAGTKRTINVQVTALTGNAKLAIAGLTATKRTVNIQVRALTGPARLAIAGLARKAPVNIKVTALTGNAKLAIAGLSRKAPVNINTKANTASAQGAINRIKGKTVSIIVTGRGMSSVQGAINRITGKTVHVYVVTHQVKGAATGGLITGPGTGTSDSIPAMLSNGEYVIRAAMVKRYRAVLDSINSGAGIPRDLSPVVRTAANAPLSIRGGSDSGGGAMVMEVRGVLDLGNSKAYISGVAHQQNQSDTAYKNSLSRVGQN